MKRCWYPTGERRRWDGSPSPRPMPAGATVLRSDPEVSPSHSDGKAAPYAVAVATNVSRLYHLVGMAEIAALLNLTELRVNQIERQDETFPKPAAVLQSGKIWCCEDIER